MWRCKGPYTSCPVGDHVINRHRICVKRMFLNINHPVLPKYFILYRRIRFDQCSRLILLQELAKQCGRETAKMTSKDEVVLKIICFPPFRGAGRIIPVVQKNGNRKN